MEEGRRPAGWVVMALPTIIPAMAAVSAAARSGGRQSHIKLIVEAAGDDCEQQHNQQSTSLWLALRCICELGMLGGNNCEMILTRD